MSSSSHREQKRKDCALNLRTDRSMVQMVTTARRLLHDQLPKGIISNNSDVVRLAVTFLIHKLKIRP